MGQMGRQCIGANGNGLEVLWVAGREVANLDFRPGVRCGGEQTKAQHHKTQSQ
jgi:hypothetical protein